MKTTYRIEAWCECVDATKQNTIFNWLVAQLKIQKTNGNITIGNVSKVTSESPETTEIKEGI